MPAAIPTVGPNGGTLVLVDTLSVPLKNASGTFSTTVLEDGVNYVAVASGTARIANDATGFADAEFIRYNKSTGPQDGSSPGYAWNNHGVRLDGVVGGGTTGNFWGGYQADHTYVATVTGQGTTVRGWYSDIPGYYGDNSGTLTVQIYRESLVGSASGRAFLDDDNNFTDDGETGVSGQPVQLLQGTTLVRETVTDSDGRYQFVDVPAGLYTVKIARTADYVSTNVTIDSLWLDYVSVPVGATAGGIDFAMQFGQEPGPTEINPFFAEAAPALAEAAPSANAPVPPAPQAKHGVDWSTLTKVADNVKPWEDEVTGSDWTAKTYSGKTIRFWSGDPGQPTTYFCHGLSFGGVGQKVVIDGKEVIRDFSPYSGSSVNTLLGEEYEQQKGLPTVAAAGDIAVWRDADGNVIHTCIISSPDNRAVGLALNGTTVKTKNGQNAEANTTLSEVNKEYAKSKVTRDGTRVALPTTLEIWRLK